MPDPSSAVLVEGGQTVTTKWWIEPERDRDVYALHVLRYHDPLQDRPDGDLWARWGEHLDAHGRWHVIDEGTLLPEPTLVLSGMLLHALSFEGSFVDRHEIGASLSEVARRVVAAQSEAPR